MASFIKPPKKFNFKKGITNDTLFLKGPTKLVSPFLKKLKTKSINVFVSPETDKSWSWDIDKIKVSETIAMYFTGDMTFDASCLMLLAKFNQFPPDTLAYVDPDYQYKNEIIEIFEEVDIDIFDKKDKMEAKVVEFFKYLEERK